MSNKWIAFLVFCWLMAAVFGAIYDKSDDICNSDTAGVEHCAENDLAFLLNGDNVVRYVGIMGVQIPILNPQWMGVFMQALTLQFSFITGQWMIVWLLIAAPLVAAAVFGIITWGLQIIQGFVPG